MSLLDEYKTLIADADPNYPMDGVYPITTLFELGAPASEYTLSEGYDAHKPKKPFKVVFNNTQLTITMDGKEYVFPVTPHFRYFTNNMFMAVQVDVNRLVIADRSDGVFFITIPDKEVLQFVLDPLDNETRGNKYMLFGENNVFIYCPEDVLYMGWKKFDATTKELLLNGVVTHILNLNDGEVMTDPIEQYCVQYLECEPSDLFGKIFLDDLSVQSFDPDKINPYSQKEVNEWNISQLNQMFEYMVSVNPEVIGDIRGVMVKIMTDKLGPFTR